MAGFAFVDVEASGLSRRGYPVEIGWVLADGRTASVLVRPEAAWGEDGWDPAAEAVHGISRAALAAHGLPCPRVAAAMVRDLSAVVAVSDGVAHDTRWIDMVFRAAGTRRPFRIVGADALFARLGLPDGAHEAVFERARAERPPTGRAVGDALHLFHAARIAAAMARGDG